MEVAAGEGRDSLERDCDTPPPTGYVAFYSVLPSSGSWNYFCWFLIYPLVPHRSGQL